MSKFDEIATYAQSHDFATEMEEGVWETDTETDPMVTTSLRLPKSLLDWVREQAAGQHVRPSGLIRQWIEQRRDSGGAADIEDLAARLARLERTVFSDTRAS
jgi:Arc/MetJ-type ribon-helix-helix transcriptional regulator